MSCTSLPANENATLVVGWACWGASCLIAATILLSQNNWKLFCAKSFYVVYLVSHVGTSVIRMLQIFVDAYSNTFLLSYFNFCLLMFAGASYFALGYLLWTISIMKENEFYSLRRKDVPIILHRGIVLIGGILLAVWLGVLIPLTDSGSGIVAMIGWYTPGTIAAFTGILNLAYRAPVWQTRAAVFAGIAGMVDFLLPILPGNCSWLDLRDGLSRLLDALLYVPFILPVIIWIDLRLSVAGQKAAVAL